MKWKCNCCGAEYESLPYGGCTFPGCNNKNIMMFSSLSGRQGADESAVRLDRHNEDILEKEREKQYRLAQEYIKGKPTPDRLAEAIKILRFLGAYKDSAALIQKCEKKLNKFHGGSGKNRAVVMIVIVLMVAVLAGACYLIYKLLVPDDTYVLSSAPAVTEALPSQAPFASFPTQPPTERPAAPPTEPDSLPAPTQADSDILYDTVEEFFKANNLGGTFEGDNGKYTYTREAESFSYTLRYDFKDKNAVDSDLISDIESNIDNLQQKFIETDIEHIKENLNPSRWDDFRMYLVFGNANGKVIKRYQYSPSDGWKEY